MSAPHSETVDHARRVLTIEAEALQQLSNHLPDDFAPLIEAILACSGRVIVSGVGKSGHIGRKISATLASTGTPSYFVHATEASHGDLGMIVEGDLCLLISNSGETTELRDIVAHTRRFSIPMAAISSKAGSTLMKTADFALGLPAAPEACAIGLAPTTSTTMMIALGDAMAVALMKRRNFKAENFSVFHPGGKLGAQMTTVGELMHPVEQMPLVAPDTSMQDTLIEMSSKGFGVAVVVENDRVIGIISDGDLRRHMHHLLEKTAAEIASLDPITVQPDMFAADAMRIMNSRKIGVLVVVNANQKPQGIFHIHDLLRAGVA